MLATAVDYRAFIEAMPDDTVSILSNVSWQEYESLVEGLEGRRDIRLTYDRGRMMIMTISAEHELPAKTLPHLIFVLAQECGLNFLSFGSTTLRKRDVASGTEPDDCYYFQHYQAIARKKWIDLTIDPPPDLVLEVDITHPSLDKFPIYAAFGVPELWLHDDKQMHFFHLKEKRYVECSHSLLFPFLTPEAIPEHLQMGLNEGIIEMVNSFRTWVVSQRNLGAESNG
jgi:Uma2 family endonuclease